MSTRDCISTIRNAAGAEISDDEILEIAEVIQRRRKALIAEGKVDNLDAKVAKLAAEEGERAKLAAALVRKHAALNAIARDNLETHVGELVAGGMKPREAVRTVLLGSTKGIGGARASVAASRMAYEGRYIAEMFAAIQRDRPHIRGMLNDGKMWDDTLREIYALRDGGKPGITKNDDAKYLAGLVERFSERSRADLNSLGANIGRLKGWAPQVHDAHHVRKTSPDAWADFILPRLDTERTFPDLVGDDAAIRKVMEDVYTTIATGKDRTITAREKGEFVGPANLARSLGRHRVLHFKTADDWLDYSRKFGYDNLFANFTNHQRSAARMAAQMSVLGPNPESMLASLTESMKRRIRNDPKMSAEAKAKAMAGLTDDPTSALGIALAEVRGLTHIPADGRVTASEIGAGFRAVQSMAKLGGAVLSAVFPDPVIAAANLNFQGKPLLAAYRDTLREVVKGRGKGEAAEIAFLIGEGFDGLIGNIISPYHAEDGAPGWMSRRLVDFFKWSGLSGQADVMRAAVARTLAAHVGSMSGKAFKDLDPAFRHVLSLHGVDAKKWNVVRKTAWTGENGTTYMTPDRIAGLSDDEVKNVISDEIAAAHGRASLRGRKSGAEPRADLTEVQQQWFDGWLARRIARERLDLEIAMRGYFSDEVSFSHIESDEALRALTLQGSRPGSTFGEAARFIMQFKGFPIAFAQRVLGRAVRGGEGGKTAGAFHIGHLIAGLTIAGYMSMTAKDMVKGYEPRQPETPAQWAKVLFAAMAQGGGGGIYGDFLFGEANRYGGRVAGTLLGPTIGTGVQLVELWQRAKQGDAKAADLLNIAIANAPGANLWYVRPALDGLFLSAMHEAASPGYLRRQERRRKEDYSQERAWPADWWSGK